MPARYPGVYVEEVSSVDRLITGVATSITAFIGRTLRGPVNEPETVSSTGDFERKFGGLWVESAMSYAVHDFYRNGGSRAVIVRLSNSDGGGELQGVDFQGSRERRTGIYALENAEFNLLCIPALPGEDVPSGVYSTALGYCEERRAILIVDPPAEWGQASDPAEKAKAAEPILTGKATSNAAIYFPRIVAPDPLCKDELKTFVPCGAVAGVIARTDEKHGVWKAPAGSEAALTGIHSLEVDLTDAENGMLNPLAINCLRSFPSMGRVIWGARTLRGADQLADEYKYLPVRRLALHIEESLYRGTQWVVFEKNDEPLWAQIRLKVGAFLNSLFRQGALQGVSPHDAYFVKCDNETTTQNDINLGIVNIRVGFAPLKPAEFVIVRIQQIAVQIET